MASLDKFVKAVKWAADSDLCGYSQSDRDSIKGNFHGSKKVNADCSSLVIYALQYAGFGTGDAGYTGNLAEELIALGWKKVKKDGKPKAGDILLNEEDHVAVCIGNGMVAEASRDEHGRYTGGARGDQDGNEVRTRKYYDFPWDFYLRWTGTSDVSSTSSTSGNNSSAKTTAKTPAQPQYRAYFNGNWQAWMSGGKVAGASASKMYDFEAKNLGPKGWFQLTLMNGTVLGKNKTNSTHKQAIRGITVFYDTPSPKQTGYYEAVYRVRPYGKQWLQWEHDDDNDGAGDDKNAVCCIQLKIAKC